VAYLECVKGRGVLGDLGVRKVQRQTLVKGVGDEALEAVFLLMNA